MATTQRSSSSGPSIARAVSVTPTWAKTAMVPAAAVPTQARKRSAPPAPTTVSKVILPLALGGAAGGAASVTLVKLGLSPNMALGAVAAGGAVGAYVAKGSARLFAGGAASLAAGQLVIGLIAKQLAKKAAKAPAAQPVATAPRQDPYGGMAVDEAFRNARGEMDDEDDR